MKLSKKELMVECAEELENGMIKIQNTRDIWQNDLIYWLCKSVKILLEDRIRNAE